MAITADHPRPVVRGTTGLNSHGAWRKLREELLHRAAPKLATQHNGSRSINSVNLKHVLRQIQTNCANLAHGRLPCLVESTSPVWHTDAVGGRPPHHCEERSDEAIHGSARGKMDCFAALATTGMVRCLSSYKRFIEVIPFGIQSFDQGQFLRTTACLDLLFPNDRVGHSVVQLVPHQYLATIFSREAFR